MGVMASGFIKLVIGCCSPKGGKSSEIQLESTTGRNKSYLNREGLSIYSIQNKTMTYQDDKNGGPSMAQNAKQHILILEDHDEDKEIEFELRWLLSLTVEQRFQLMIRRTQELLKLLEKSGHPTPFDIVKRASS